MKTTNFVREPNTVRSLRVLLTPSRGHKPMAALSAPTYGQPFAKSRKRILLVDDDAIILKTTSMKLESRGYTVATATDGANAIHAVRKEKPDLILLDLSFPADAGGGAVPWDGFLIMSWLHRLDEARNIPVIVITGGDPVRYKDRSLASGAIAFFHKPLDHHNLLSLIERTVYQDNGFSQTDFDTNFHI